MRRPYIILAFLALLSATAHAAEHDWPAQQLSEPNEQTSFSITNRAGLVEAPFVTPAFPQVSGFGTVLIGTAAVRLLPIGWLRLSVPVSIVRLDFPAGAQVSETALGNIALGLEHVMALGRATRFGAMAVFLAPSAEQGPKVSLLDNRALALAAALSGGKQTPLLTPGVTGLRLGASVEHSRGALELRASVDVPLLVRFSDARLPEQAETHRFGILPVLDVAAAYWITHWLGASLGAAVIAEPLRVQEPTRERDRARRLQPVVEPGFHAALGTHVSLVLDTSIPVAGALGGDAFGVGLQGRIGL